MNGKLRLSYTLLRLWMDGKKDEIVPCYLRLETKMTPAMKRGKEFDKYVKEFVIKNRGKDHYSKLPPELGGEKLFDPLPSHTITVSYNDNFDLKVEFDILVGDTIIEVKNSEARDSADFSNDLQISIYFLACELSGMNFSKGVLFAYNPLKRLYDRSIIWRSERRLQEAKQAIEKYGPEIHKYLLGEGVL